MKELLNAGLLHGDCLTVTGKTVAENLRDVPLLADLGDQVIGIIVLVFVHRLAMKSFSH